MRFIDRFICWFLGRHYPTPEYMLKLVRFGLHVPGETYRCVHCGKKLVA